MPDHLVKVNEYAGLRWWRRCGRSKAHREMLRAVAIAARGIPTPIPVICGELRHGPLLECCYEVVPWLDDAIDLRNARDTGVGTAAERRACVAALGVLVRRMHDSGIDQRDLAPNNFLWRRGADPTLLAIDFERARVGASVALAARVAALAKLDRHCATASASERMRFLYAYCAGDRVAARSLSGAIEAASAALLRRDATRWGRTATRRGRRFESVVLPVAGVQWRGWVRRGTSADALRDAVARPDAPAATLALRAIDCVTGRAAAAVLGLALALHQRAVLPAPVGLLCGADRAWLILETTGTPIDPASESSERSRLVVLLDRLLSWGGLASPLRLDAMARIGSRCVLLDPSALRLEMPRVAVGRRALARRLANPLATPSRGVRGERDGSRP